MGRHRLRRLLLLPIGLLTLLVFSTRLARTQEKPSASETPIQFGGLVRQYVAVPEAKIRFHPLYENLSLPFAPSQGQTAPLVRFRTLDIGYPPPSTTNNVLPKLWQLTKTDELQAGATHFIRNTPIEWLSGVNNNNKVHFRKPDPGGDVRYYGHRIPWAGQVVLGIGEQAKFHPRVIRVLKLIDPQDVRFENRLPRGSARNIHVIVRGQHR